MVSMCSKVHSFGMQVVPGCAAELETVIAQFDALINDTEHPEYGAIYGQNIATGATVDGVRAAVVEMRRIAAEWNTAFAVIVNHIENKKPRA
jgi:hypothetical protein